VGRYAPFTLVEVTEEMPYISLRHDSDGFVISSNVTASEVESDIIITYRGATSINFIRLTPQQRPYYRRLLSIERFPNEAEPQLRRFLNRIGGDIEIHSDLIEGGSTLPICDGESKIVMQMRPSDSMYCVSFFVRRLQGGRIRCVPGEGNEVIIDNGNVNVNGNDNGNDNALDTPSTPTTQPSTPNNQPSTPTSEPKDHSLLIVEDNTELLDLMSKLFEPQYNVFTARNGRQALNVISRRDLDLVITDVMMPVMDGIELTREIKNSPDYGQLPVVMLTAKTSEEDQTVGYTTGADAYITKPFKLNSLKLRIDNIIQNRERIRRKFMRQTDFKVEEQHYSSPDEVFIQKCIDTVKQHLDDSDFDREQFAAAMCVSSSTLYNKLRALTGQNVTGFINSIRLKEACRLLRQQPDMRINELSMAVGFNTPKYFTKCFKREFGLLPKEYLEQEQQGEV